MDINRKELSAIKEVLKEGPRGMTVTEISKSVKMNRHSVAKYLEVLVAAGHVDMKSFGPSKVYYLSQRVPVSAMLSYSSDLIVILDNDLRARSMNDKFLEYMRLKREDVLNRNIENFAFTRLAKPPLLPGIKDALGGKERTVDTYYHNGEREYYLTVKFIPAVFEGGEKGATIIASDVTMQKHAEAALARERGELEARIKERTAELELANASLKAEIERRAASENALRESEERYRALVENINDIAWETDRDALFTYVSPKVKDIMGYGPEYYIGKAITDFMPPGDIPRFIGKLRRVLAKPGPFSLAHVRMYHMDGRILDLEANGAPLYDGKGRFRGLRGVTRDITKR